MINGAATEVQRNSGQPRPLYRLLPVPVFDDPCVQPLPDEPQDSFVRNTVPEKLLQPRMIELGKEVADVSVEHVVHLLP